MAGARSNLRTAACAAGVLGVISLLFFPFAGFTERTAYVPSPIFRDYGLVGIGTYGQDFNLLAYPAVLWFVQVAVLLLAVVLGYSVVRCWRSDPGPVIRIASIVAGASVVLTVVALVVVFPAVEERTIWVTESNGWVQTWWVDYGAFVSPLAAAAMALLLHRDGPQTAAPPPETGPAPAPPPEE